MRTIRALLQWGLAISCVLLLSFPHVFGQAEFFWASAVDGDFSEYKWNAARSVPSVNDRVYLNATMQPYTVNVLGTFEIAGLDVGLADPPYSNVTLHFRGEALLNVSSNVTLFTGAALSASDANNTLQMQHFTSNGGQITVLNSSSMYWKTSVISINEGSKLDIQDYGVIFFTANNGTILSKETELLLAPCSQFNQPIGSVFFDGHIRSNNGGFSFSDDVTFGPNSVVSLRNDSRASLGSSPVDLFTLTISTPYFLVENSNLTFLSSADTQIIIRSTTPPASRVLRPAHLNISEPYSLVVAKTVHVEGEDALLSVSNFGLLGYSLLEVSNGAAMEVNNGRVSATLSTSTRAVVTGRSTVSVALSGGVQMPPVAREIEIENESLLHVGFSSTPPIFTQSARMTVANSSRIIVEGRGVVIGFSSSDLLPFVVSDNSSVQLLGPESSMLQMSSETSILRNSSFILQRRSYFSIFYQLLVSNGSILSASESSSVQMYSGTVKIFDSSKILLAGSNLTLDNGTIITDASSSMILQLGSRLIGVGSIQGNVFNDGGIITYSDASTKTDLYVRNLTQTNSSVISTVVSSNGSVTIVRGGTIQLGGTIVVSLGSSANVSEIGILLVNADDQLTGNTPTLLLRLQNGTLLTISADQNNCQEGYHLQRRDKSLFLVFDSATGLCDGPSTTPLALILPDFSSSNAGAIVGGVVGGVILLAIIVAAVLVFVPSLRRRVQPFLQRSLKTVHRGTSLESSMTVRMTQPPPSPSNPAWVRTKATASN